VCVCESGLEVEEGGEVSRNQRSSQGHATVERERKGGGGKGGEEQRSRELKNEGTLLDDPLETMSNFLTSFFPLEAGEICNLSR